jgi:hypothetical protein
MSAVPNIDDRPKVTQVLLPFADALQPRDALLPADNDPNSFY